MTMMRRHLVRIVGMVLARTLHLLAGGELKPTAGNRGTVYFADLSKAEPRTALSIGHMKAKWQVLAYQTETRKGRMLYTDPESEALPLRLPLNLQGWHAIFVGMPGIDQLTAFVKLKLSGDRDYHLFQLDPAAYGFMDEGFWQVADLTGQDLIIAQAGIGKETKAGLLGHVKCVPLTDEEVAQWQREESLDTTKRLIAFNDGHSIFHSGFTRSPEDIRMWIEPFRGTDFERLVWGALDMDVAQFPSRVATPFGAGITSFFAQGDHLFAEILEEYQRLGQNPLEIARDAAHEAGLKISFAVRMNYLKPPPYDEVFGMFFWDHPELWLLQRDSLPGGLAFACPAVSYACVQVQDRMRKVIKEIALLNPDGVHLLYTRFPPFIGYEDAATVPFNLNYGMSPKDLPDDDPRWLDFKAEIMTEFMKKLRADLDEVGASQSRYIELSASVEGREADLRSSGIDLAAWMQLGLLDWVVAYPLHDEANPKAWESLEVVKFVQWAATTKCKVYAEMQGVAHEIGVQGLLRDWDKQAAHFYKLGCHGLSFWDNTYDTALLQTWNKMRWLGHQESVRSGPAFVVSRANTRDKFKGMTVFRLRSEAELDQTR